MSVVVLSCGDVVVPTELAEFPLASAPLVPASDDVAAALKLIEKPGVPADAADPDAGPEPRRLVVVGTDKALAAVLTELMRTEQLSVELAYVTRAESPATTAYRLATGFRGAYDAVHGEAHPLPLIRDDHGIALVGEAVYTGPEGAPLSGEMFVDDHLLFSGETAEVRVMPSPIMPGVRASVNRKPAFLPRKWYEGRAAQLGGPGAALTRDGVPAKKPLKRSTFYRDHREWLLVR
jgi:hypothetical protein